MIRLKQLCLILGACLLGAIALGVLWLGGKVALYNQLDSQVHLVGKKNYLQRISQLPQTVDRPNIVLILFDDLGYGDLGVTGSQAISTPNIDQLAKQGLNLSNFYAPAPVCTPSRAGFLTGRLPLRAGMPSVVFPSESSFNVIHKLSDTNIRFPAEEITLADVLQAAGYATGMVGKWHLGDQSPSLPNDMGFEEYFGALYSNDMTPFSLYRNRDIEISAPADQTRLNEWYGRETSQFIERHNKEPFFLYFAHNFPHIPLYRPDKDTGRSKGGLYGDVVEGLDDVVGRLVSKLKSEGVYENTIILITSDNGPWYQGSPANSRGRKSDTFEGGMHVPMIVHWPAKLEGGKTITGISMGTDWFPTFLDWLDLPLPGDRIIDGSSLRGMLENNESSPNDYVYYFSGKNLMAIRDARYKYHDRRGVVHATSGLPIAFSIPKGPWLFDTFTDFNESYDVSLSEPEVTVRMEKALKVKRKEMKENMRGWVVKND
ncbi:MAG: sulfatase [Halioglobus sp.]